MGAPVEETIIINRASQLLRRSDDLSSTSGHLAIAKPRLRLEKCLPKGEEELGAIEPALYPLTTEDPPSML